MQSWKEGKSCRRAEVVEGSQESQLSLRERARAWTSVNEHERAWVCVHVSLREREWVWACVSEHGEESHPGGNTGWMWRRGREHTWVTDYLKYRKLKAVRTYPFPANNLQWDFERLPSLFSISSLEAPLADWPFFSPKCQCQNYVNTIITILRFMFTRLTEAWR